jgi:hypothetical protein
MVERSTRQAQIEQLRDEGYVVVPRFVAVDGLTTLNEVAMRVPRRLWRSGAQRGISPNGQSYSCRI